MKRVKVMPSKGQSIAGFVVGIIFVFIGCIFVIPMAGDFGILWTVMSLVITIIHFINGFTDNGIATHNIMIDAENVHEHTDDVDIEEKLLKLESLYNSGLISCKEYEEKRKQIIDEF